MPKLSEIGDVEELDNLYTNKTIVYVEGEDDEAVFSNIVGPNVRDKLEFKVPKVEGSGYLTVKKRVAEERSNNPKVFGLLDGEAAASLGHYNSLLTNQDILFSVNDPGLEGIRFLAEHELENLVLCHANLATFLSQNVTFGELGKKEAEPIGLELLTMARRFYVLAMCKMAAHHLHQGGVRCPEVDASAGLFQGKHDIPAILRIMKKKMQDAGGDWNRFLKQVVLMQRQVKVHSTQQGFDEDARHREILRLTAGKAMLKQVTDRYKGHKAWEGQLASRLTAASYVDQFRETLLATTAAA